MIISLQKIKLELGNEKEDEKIKEENDWSVKNLWPQFITNPTVIICFCNNPHFL